MLKLGYGCIVFPKHLFESPWPVYLQSWRTSTLRSLFHFKMHVLENFKIVRKTFNFLLWYMKMVGRIIIEIGRTAQFYNTECRLVPVWDFIKCS